MENLPVMFIYILETFYIPKQSKSSLENKNICTYLALPSTRIYRIAIF